MTSLYKFRFSTEFLSWLGCPFPQVCNTEQTFAPDIFTLIYAKLIRCFARKDSGAFFVLRFPPRCVSLSPLPIFLAIQWRGRHGVAGRVQILCAERPGLCLPPDCKGVV